jgi:hypothetical protein
VAAGQQGAASQTQISKLAQASRVTRIKRLTPGQQQRLAALRRMSRLLDSAYQVPGTSYRIGLDPILGLVPGLGDLISPLFTIALLWQGRDLNLPRVVQLRMLFNVAIDTVVGMVPIAGDLFDFAWKANDMNMALIERHAADERAASAGDWIFVLGLTLLLLLVAAIPFVLVAWIFSAVPRRLF